jgi:DNA-binding winged helix-turn-helix (wHTH) protein
VLTDPHKKVSRQHCIIGWESGRWQLIDEGSANGTFLRQRNCDGTEVDVRSVDTIPLHDGDTILILGKLINSQEPVFWQLTFHDPNQTDAVYDFQAPAELVYDFREQRLFQVNRQERTEIRLSPQERSLIHRLAQCNQNNNDQPTVCEHQELIKAVWKEPFGHTSNDIAALVFGIREKIESDSGEPQYLKTERGQGYLLNVRIQ